MNHFDNCTSFDELRQSYLQLCLHHHPDRGGNPDIMLAINNERSIAWNVLPRYQLTLIVRQDGDSTFPKHPCRTRNLPNLTYYDNGVPYFEDWEYVWDLLLR